jgi:RNA polymerase sigma-70 factor (ECF subfamily)
MGVARDLCDAELKALVLRSGDPAAVGAAWAILHARHFEHAVWVAYHIVRDVWPEPTDEATDVAQEAMIKAYENLDQYDDGQPFWPWLQAIVVRLAIDRLRQRGRLHRYLRGYLLRLRGDDRVGLSPLDVLILREDNVLVLACVRDAVAGLKPLDRDVLLRHHVGKASVAELAAEYLRAEQTLRGRLCRAKKRLLNRLGIRLSNGKLTRLLEAAFPEARPLALPTDPACLTPDGRLPAGPRPRSAPSPNGDCAAPGNDDRGDTVRAPDPVRPERKDSDVR